MVISKTRPTPFTSPGETGTNNSAHFRTFPETSLHVTTSTYTLAELVERFLASCRRASPRSGRRLSPRTLEFYQMCLSGLLYFSRLAEWPSAAEISRQHLADFRYYMETEPCRWNGDTGRCTYKTASSGTVHHYLNVAGIFFRWCVDEEYLRESPLQRYRVPAADYKDVEPYSDHEVGAMLATCQYDIDRGNRYFGVRNKAVVSVFTDTGLRLEELAAMKLSNLDPQLQQIRVLGKGAKMRVVPLNGEARKALRLYLNQYRQPGGDEVWQTEDGEPLARRGVQIMLTRLKRRAGVDTGGGAHRFRHYFATRYLEAGGDINNLRLLLGHATLYMVLKYTRYVNVKSALENHAEFSPLDRLTNGASQHAREENWGWRQ